MRKGKILMGILFIIAGIGLVIDRLGYLQGISVFNLLATVYLMYIIVKSIVKVNIFGILVPMGLLGVIYWDLIGPSHFNPWTLVWAGGLVSLGISIIFKPRKRFRGFREFRDKNKKEVYGEDDGAIYVESMFAECIRYLQGDGIHKIKLDNTFGGMKIYLDNIEIAGDSLLVDIDSSFGGIELYIPREWEVVNNLDVSFGGVEEKNREMVNKTSTLVLEGDVNFGGLEIIYIG